MAETRVSRYKNKREQILSDNILQLQSESTTKDLEKIKKTVAKMTKKNMALTRIIELGEDIQKKIDIQQKELVDKDSPIFSHIDLEDIKKVVKKIKETEKLDELEETPVASLIKGAASEIENSAVNSDNAKHVTQIVNTFEIEKDEKGLDIEKERLAIANLKNRITNMKEDTTVNATLDTDEINRISELTQLKMSEKHIKRTTFKLILLLLLTLGFMWLVHWFAFKYIIPLF